MADEETTENEALECECVKWHSPKSPITVVGGVPVCLVTATQVDALLRKYAAKGRVVKADQRGFTKYQRELSEKVYAEQRENPVVEAEPESVSAEA